MSQAEMVATYCALMGFLLVLCREEQRGAVATLAFVTVCLCTLYRVIW